MNKVNQPGKKKAAKRLAAFPNLFMYFYWFNSKQFRPRIYKRDFPCRDANQA
jgi:hypothetical protein